MEEEQVSTANSILQIINELFGNIFSSIDNSIYELLDKITFINTELQLAKTLINIAVNIIKITNAIATPVINKIVPIFLPPNLYSVYVAYSR